VKEDRVQNDTFREMSSLEIDCHSQPPRSIIHNDRAYRSVNMKNLRHYRAQKPDLSVIGSRPGWIVSTTSTGNRKRKIRKTEPQKKKAPETNSGRPSLVFGDLENPTSANQCQESREGKRHFGEPISFA